LLRYRLAGMRRNCIASFTCSCAREFQKSHESLSITRPARMRTGSTTWKDSKMTNFKLLGAGNCTGSCSRARLAGFLPEPGCRIPIKRDSECYGIGTWRLLRERARKAPVSEALRQRSQVNSTSPAGAALVRMVIAPAMRTSRRPVGSKGGPTGRLCYWALLFKCRIRPAQCSGPGKG
jgi:hypothetical protein